MKTNVNSLSHNVSCTEK